MKKAVIVFILTFIILSAKFIYSHGFGTHAAHYSAILALNDQYKTLIEDPRYKPYFIYGSIFPDIQYATNYKSALLELYQKIEDISGVEGLTYEILVDQIPDVSTTPYPFGIDTHNDKYGMAFAEYLLQQCNPIDPPGPNPGSNGTNPAHDARNMKLAFALGYYAHLTEDVAAHDFLVPKLTAALNLGDIELIRKSETFADDPNSQTEGIIEGIIDHFYGDNNLIADIIYNHVWVNRSQYEPTIAQMDFTTGYAHLLYNGPTPTYYDAQGGWPEMNPVLLFFNAVLNDWYSNNPFGLPAEYKEGNSPMSAAGLNQLATVFRFVNRFYPAVAGHPFNGYDRLDQVLADWIGNHLDYTPGVDILIIFGQVMTMFDLFDIRSLIFEGIAYPKALAETNAGLAEDARSLVSLMLADMNEADRLVNAKPDLVNITEYNKLKNSVLFTNPTSVLNTYWNEYESLGVKVYQEIGPGGKWYSDWSPWHSHSMAWGALSSLNNLIPDIYSTNLNVAVYDAYFEVNQRRIIGPEPATTFNNNPNVKVVVELYNTSNVSSESLTLRVKKDHSSSDYSSDVLKNSTPFIIDHDPLTYNTTARKRVELTFPVSLSDLSGYKGYYFELVNNSNNKVIFTSSFEQYQERLDLTPNYTRLYGTYDEGKWPVSFGLIQSVATVNLTTAEFPEGGGSGGSYKINGITQSSIIGYVDDYINLEAVPPSGYKFYQWSDGNTANPRTYRIPSTSINLYATYKGQGLSSDLNAFTSSSQRKFVRSSNGWMHLVYESMGKVWYETSTDNGVTWNLMNNGQPLCSDDAKYPDIFVSDGEAKIVYLKGGNSIEVIRYYYSADVKITQQLDPINLTSYQENASPVISMDDDGNYIVIVWKGTQDSFGWENKLYYRIAKYNGSIMGYEWNGDAAPIPNTDQNSFRPAIDSYIPHLSTNNIYHFAWQQNISPTSSEIRYYKLIINSDETVQLSDYASPSNGNGYSYNYGPSLIILKDGIPRLTWHTWNGGSTRRAYLRGKTSSWDSRFYSFGSGVTSVNIAKHLVGTVGGYVFGWNFGDRSKYIRNTNFNNFIDFEINGDWLRGYDLQVNNGSTTQDFSVMYGKVLNTDIPYNFQQSYSVQSLGKENSVQTASSSRTAIISKDKIAFRYTLGDITINGKKINFIEIPDTTKITDVKKLNEFLITEPIEVDDKSIINFSVSYDVLDSVRVLAELKEGKSVNFRVELTDGNNEKTLGVIDEVVSDKTKSSFRNSSGYEFKTEGIGYKTVRLRIVANNNFSERSPLDKADYFLEDHYDEEASLPKTKNVQLNYKQDFAINNYDLFHNYPNPFNPSTTINYQIPTDGFVTLKIYDALGREVNTLVNEFKTTGRYEVNFDASKLASGVYIYSIKSGSFTASKKMILLR